MIDERDFSLLAVFARIALRSEERFVRARWDCGKLSPEMEEALDVVFVTSHNLRDIHPDERNGRIMDIIERHGEQHTHAEDEAIRALVWACQLAAEPEKKAK